MQTVMQTLHSVVHFLRSYFDSLVSSPHRIHVVVYAGAALAALLICIPLARLIFGSRHEDADASSLSTASPSMLGLSSPSIPSIDFEPAAKEFMPPTSSPVASNVTAINESMTAPCIHCGVTMSSRQDFCPACGYAQPMRQSITA